MASSSSSSKKALSLVFYITLFCFLSGSVSASRTSPSDVNSKVKLGLYYESLCPYSANFIINYLVKIFEDVDLLSIVDLHLSPWGNAKIRANNSTFDCQHGPSECLLNTVEACAIDSWPELNKHFPFIYCIESLVYEHKYSQWETCFDKLELDPKPIVDCYTSGYGTQLELKYAAETNSLVPPHQYVPWVVVEGQPLYEDYENFISYVCKAYKGNVVPKACSNLFLITNYYGVEQKPVFPVGYNK
ncbi:gamma-interferon-inducible lysosomal thiol reductase [Citrus sinensis]|uniref:Gamma-interferon-inducible lysosomal thiol reductase n=1 Tax=Citrus sinensis TaxID=2711 RepID=A0ACB8IY04_CITSI|nr:gamma-interferon-inducible lysosomal thiol reductase [Citrus sinensis]